MVSFIDMVHTLSPAAEKCVLKNFFTHLLAACFLLSARATAAQPITVGNASMTPVPASAREQYGVTDPYSTHQRNGNITGIGGSTIGTESVTSESRARPAMNGRNAADSFITRPKLRLPSDLEQPTVTPAILQTPSFLIRAPGTFNPARGMGESIVNPNIDNAFHPPRLPALEPNSLGTPNRF